MVPTTGIEPALRPKPHVALNHAPLPDLSTSACVFRHHDPGVLQGHRHWVTCAGIGPALRLIENPLPLPLGEQAREAMRTRFELVTSRSTGGRSSTELTHLGATRALNSQFPALATRRYDQLSY